MTPEKAPKTPARKCRGSDFVIINNKKQLKKRQVRVGITWRQFTLQPTPERSVIRTPRTVRLGGPLLCSLSLNGILGRAMQPGVKGISMRAMFGIPEKVEGRYLIWPLHTT